MMIGYASNESEEYMPLPISISHSITRKMAELRKNNNLDWIRPDGKSQITFEYDANGKPVRINTVVISTQHNPNISQEDIKNELMEKVCGAAIPEKYLDSETKFNINP